MFVSISFCILRKKKPEMARPYKVKAGRFVGVMAVLMAGFMTLLYIVPASFSAALVWQEWIVVGIWLALGAFFYFYSKKKYGAEFGRDIFIVEDGGKAEEQEEAVLQMQSIRTDILLLLSDVSMEVAVHRLPR